jgi:hypothetical protein
MANGEYNAGGKSGIRSQKSNQKPETRNQKPETRNKGCSGSTPNPNSVIGGLYVPADGREERSFLISDF